MGLTDQQAEALTRMVDELQNITEVLMRAKDDKINRLQNSIDEIHASYNLLLKRQQQRIMELEKYIECART